MAGLCPTDFVLLAQGYKLEAPWLQFSLAVTLLVRTFNVRELVSPVLWSTRFSFCALSTNACVQVATAPSLIASGHG